MEKSELSINRRQALKIGTSTLVFSGFAIPKSISRSTAASVTDTSFDGYVYDPAGNPMGDVDVTVIEYPPEPTTPPGDMRLHTAKSDADGYFNVTGIEGDGMMYQVRMEHQSGETVEYASKSVFTIIPPEYFFALDTNDYYLEEAVNVTVDTVGDESFTYTFYDAATNFALTADTEGDVVTSATFSGPASRDYVIEVDIEEGRKVSYLLDDIKSRSSWQNNKELHLTIDPSEEQRRVTGSVTYEGTAGFDQLNVVKYEMQGSFLGYSGEIGESDEFNAEEGTFDIGINALTEHESKYGLFVTAYDGEADQHYGAFTTITFPPGKENVNLSLEPLQGGESSLTVLTPGGESTITTALKEFSLVTESGEPPDFGTGFAYAAWTTMDYGEYWDAETVGWWSDAVDPTKTTFKLPVFGSEGVDTVLLTQEYAPRKAILTSDKLAEDPVEITLSDFDPGTLDELETAEVETTSSAGTQASESQQSSVQLSLYRSGEQADIPHPEVNPIYTASLDGFNPMSASLMGSDTSLRIHDTEHGITVHFAGLDIINSQAPDAVFDIEPTTTEDGEKVLRYGSFSPDQYDKVLIGVPYDGSVAEEIAIEIKQLYDGDFNPIWDTEADTVDTIRKDSDLRYYEAYADAPYDAYLDGTSVIAKEDNEDISNGVGYWDTEAGMLWFELPHFSGVGLSIEVSAPDKYVDDDGVVRAPGLNNAVEDYLSGDLPPKSLNSIIKSYLSKSPVV